jgi:hypothetical protein
MLYMGRKLNRKHQGQGEIGEKVSHLLEDPLYNTFQELQTMKFGYAAEKTKLLFHLFPIHCFHPVTTA